MSEPTDLMPGRTDIKMVREPSAVIADAMKAAKALQDVIAKKRNPVMMNGEQYIEVDDWELLGRFFDLAGRIAYTSPIQVGDAFGYEARAEIVDMNTGKIVSTAEAMCLNDEDKWSTRSKYAWAYVLKKGGTSMEEPEKDQIVWEPNPNKPGKKRPKKERVKLGDEKVPTFQLRSMCQTRALAKGFRNVLAWVVMMAGYNTTPAEDLTGNERSYENGDLESRTPNGDEKAPEAQSKPTDQSQPSGSKVWTPSDPQIRRLMAIGKEARGEKNAEGEIHAHLELKYKITSMKEIKSREDYDAVVAWAGNKDLQPGE